jgi:predicted phosphodiesterase
MKSKVAIVVCDTHAPLHDQRAVNVVCKAMEIVKPDTFIHLGDVGEWDSVSRWKYKKKKRPPLEYIVGELEKDKKETNSLLDQFDSACKKNKVNNKIMLLGNHEMWLDNFIEEHPYLEDKYSPQAVMNLDKRGYTWYPYLEYVKIGKLYFHHGGHYRGIYHARHTVMQLGVNVMYGHFHDVSRESVGNFEGVHAAFCIGCLKKCQSTSNKWLKGKKVNWSHAFAIVNWNTDGTFVVNIVDITDGKTFVYGKQIKG